MLHQGRDAIISIPIPLWDMVRFAVIFGLAILWRKKLEYHRRLMLIASCTLTAAAGGRLPELVLPGFWFYAGVDLLIMMGVTRDLLVNRKIYRVYLIALPLFMAGHRGLADHLHRMVDPLRKRHPGLWIANEEFPKFTGRWQRHPALWTLM